MKYRLKSDPSRWIEVAEKPRINDAWVDVTASWQMWKYIGYAMSKLELFDLYEPEPVPKAGPLSEAEAETLAKQTIEAMRQPAPVLVEEELEQFGQGCVGDASQRIYELTKRAAAELRRLRKELLRLRQELLEDEYAASRRKDRLEDLTRQVQLLTQQRDEARKEGDTLRTAIAELRVKKRSQQEPSDEVVSLLGQVHVLTMQRDEAQKTIDAFREIADPLYGSVVPRAVPPDTHTHADLDRVARMLDRWAEEEDAFVEREGRVLERVGGIVEAAAYRAVALRLRNVALQATPKSK